MLRPSYAVVAMLAAALPTSTLAAAPAATAQSFKGEYTVSFLGLSVARAKFNSHYEGDSYSIDGTVSAAGLATLFDDTSGTISSKGKILGQQMQPQAFRADYKSGKKASMVDIRFANGTVTATQVLPEPKKRNPRPGCRWAATIWHRCSIRWLPRSSMPTASTRSVDAR